MGKSTFVDGFLQKSTKDDGKIKIVGWNYRHLSKGIIVNFYSWLTGLGRVQEWDSFGRLRNDNLKREERLLAIKYAQITISFVKRNSKQYISFFGATSRTNLRL